MKVTADTITDEQILDLADAIRADVVTALGEDEGGGLPPSHPLVKAAKRRLVAAWNARHGGEKPAQHGPCDDCDNFADLGENSLCTPYTKQQDLKGANR